MQSVLNQAQAEAVYSAMVALNNISARAHVRIDLEEGAMLHACEYEDGSVQVFIGDALGNRTGGSIEQFDSQYAFAKAYGVDL